MTARHNIIRSFPIGLPLPEKVHRDVSVSQVKVDVGGTVRRSGNGRRAYLGLKRMGQRLRAAVGAR